MLSKDQFAEMNAHLDETERREQALMETLRNRLSEVDQKLLENVRNIGLEHEGRRTMILTELHSLAERVGVFPVANQTRSNPELAAQHRQNDVAHNLASPTYVPQTAVQAPNGHAQQPQQSVQPPTTARRHGDWRAAAERIRQDIESKLQSSNTQSTDPWVEDYESAAPRI